MKKNLALLLFALFALQNNVFAQIILKNNTDETVWICIGYKQNGMWTSEGWWKVESGTQATLNHTTGESAYLYYYAYSNTRTYEGQGSSLIVKRGSAFTIKHTGSEGNNLAEGFEWKSFREVRISIGNALFKKRCVIDLRY